MNFRNSTELKKDAEPKKNAIARQDLEHKVKLANALPITLFFILVVIAGAMFEKQLELTYSNLVAISLLPEVKESNEEEVTKQTFEINPETQLAVDALYDAIIESSDLTIDFKQISQLSVEEQLVAKAIVAKKLRRKKHYDKSLAIIVSLTQQQQESQQLVFTKAYSLAKLGHNSAAIISYEHLLSIQISHQAANINLGLLYLDGKYFVKAEQVFTRGVENTAGNKKAKNFSGLADALYQQKKYQQALAAYQKSIEYRPAYPSSWSNLAKTARTLEDHQLALDSYQKSISLDKNNSKIRVEYADYLNSRLDFKRSIEQLKRAKAINRENISIRLKLSFSYLQAGKPINARKQLNLAKKNIQKPFEKRQSDAIQKYLSENYPEAVALLRSNLKKNRYNDFDYYLLARSYIALNKIKTAKLYINKIHSESLFYHQAKYLLAEALSAANQNEQSILLYREIIAKIADNPDLLNQASKAEQLAGNYQESIQLVKKALALRSNRRLLLRKADLIWLLGEQDDALRELEQLVDRYPSYLRAIYHLASYNHKLGKRSEAIEGFTNLLEQQANYGDAQYQLSVIYFENNDFTQSQQLLKAYLQRKPASKRSRLLYARTFCETGQFQTCEEQLELVLKFAPDYKPAFDLQQSLKDAIK